jgi:hypothetical protein
MSNTTTIINKAPWKDTRGEAIRAHGGGFLYSDEYYYWFGENRMNGVKVSCYRSRDLKTWEFYNDVLTLDSKVKPLYYRASLDLNPHQTEDGATIERPKVLYNKKSGKYVMWMHWENGQNSREARCAVASCDTADGHYTYHGSFNPIGNMSRDCTLFQDDDGTAYFISAGRDNADLLIYRLSDDYLSIEEHVKTLWPGQFREAPAVMKRNGLYFLISSGCTGWSPNQGTYAYSDTLTGRWSSLFLLGDQTTYDSQPTFILTIPGKESTSYFYVGDRWDPTDYHKSSYILLPLSFPSEREMKLEWADEVTINWETGQWNTVKASFSGLYRFKICDTKLYLGAADTHAIGKRLSYGDPDQKWIIEQSEEGYVRIKSSSNNRFLAVDLLSNHDHFPVLLSEPSKSECLDWSFREMEEGMVKIINRSTGKALTFAEEESPAAILTEYTPEHDHRLGRDPQLLLITKVL